MKRHSLAAVLWLPALCLTAPVLAQDPCTLTPYDGTNENGLGAAPGFVIEYCSEITVPALCLDRGAYFVNAVVVEATRTNADTTMPFTAQVRRGAAPVPAGPLPPGDIVAGPAADVVTGVQSFPQSQTWVTTTLDARGEFSVGLAAVELHSACGVLDGDATGGQFLGTDETPTTPLNRCWKGDGVGVPFEDCTVGAPDLRALRVGLLVSPFGGLGDAKNVVPPVTSPATAVARLGPETVGGSTFWLDARHNVTNPTAAHIHKAPPGFNGPIVVDLGDPASPIDLTGLDLSGVIDELQAGNLYIDVHSLGEPAGEVRGQIESAGDFIFADGFESGDLSAWSRTVP